MQRVPFVCHLSPMQQKTSYRLLPDFKIDPAMKRNVSLFEWTYTGSVVYAECKLLRYGGRTKIAVQFQFIHTIKYSEGSKKEGRQRYHFPVTFAFIHQCNLGRPLHIAVSLLYIFPSSNNLCKASNKKLFALKLSKKYLRAFRVFYLAFFSSSQVDLSFGNVNRTNYNTNRR